MIVQHVNSQPKGEFFISEMQSTIASLHYVFAGDSKLIIDHTEVNPQHAGKGLGNALILALVAFARENSYKVLPLCPYARKVMERTEEYKDILF